MTELDVSAPTVPPTYAMSAVVALSDLRNGAARDPSMVVRSAHRLRGPLDLDALRAALDDLVTRHDALRMALAAGEAGPMLRDSPPGQIEPQVRDLDAGANPETAVTAFVAAAGAEGVAPDAAPPLRAFLGKLSDNDAVLVLTCHHLWSDAWSMRVLVRDLALCYRARAAGQTPPESTAMSYRDVALDDHGAAHQQRIADRQPYWAQRLVDIDTPLARRIPTEVAGQVRVSEQYALEMPAAVLEQLRTGSRRARTTPFVTALTAYLLWLHRETGATDLCVPTITAGRTPQEYSTVGLFINAPVMRADLAGAPTVGELQARVHRVCVDAYLHEVPFLRLLEVAPRLGELLTHPQIAFPVFQLIQFAADTEAVSWGPGLSVSPLPLPGDVGQVLPVEYLCTLELTDRLTYRIFHDPALFDTDTVRGHAADFQDILARVCAEPDTSIEEIIR